MVVGTVDHDSLAKTDSPSILATSDVAIECDRLTNNWLGVRQADEEVVKTIN